MIIYDLKCGENHEFEGWFNDRANFEHQKEQSLITCPLCGNADVEVVPSMPSVRCRDMKCSEDRTAVLSPMQMMKQLNDFIAKNFDDVGDSFAEVAMNIHNGQEDARNIKGTTTSREEDILREKGVPFFKIPVIKLDS
jgi:hypothetical protein